MTTIAVEDDLVSEIMLLTKISNQQQAITMALRTYIAAYIRPQATILELVGQDLIDPEYDVRTVRQGMEYGSS